MARNGDGLFQRGSIWYFKYKGVDGLYREKSTGKRKPSEARAFKNEFLDRFQRNQLPTEESKWKLADALEKWLGYRSGIHAKASVAAEKTSARHLIDIIGGERKLNNITAWDIRRYQTSRLESVGPKTVNNEMLVLTAVLKSARLWEPLKELYRPLVVPKRGPGQALTPDQTSRLVETAKTNDRWFVALCATVLAYSTGCRSREIKTLQLRDLVLDQGKPHLRLRAEQTKGRREREPALNEIGHWAVRQLLERARLLGASKPEHYLLPANLSKHTGSSDPLKGGTGFDPTKHQNSWSTAWENLKRAAGLEGLRFHDLRHTHITHAIEAGVPIEVVMAQVGHISADMTRYYTHLGSQAKQQAVAAVQGRTPGLLSKLQTQN
jgi:integrase